MLMTLIQQLFPYNIVSLIPLRKPCKSAINTGSKAKSRAYQII